MYSSQLFKKLVAENTYIEQIANASMKLKLLANDIFEKQIKMC